VADPDATSPECGTAAIGDLRLGSGVMLRDVEVAYETVGRLNAARSNAILLLHGYQSSHRITGRGAAWGGLLGPGKAIDTDRFYVLSTNMLGSAYGSTGPGTIDPASGRRYGPNFPDISVADMVAAQRRFLAMRGIDHLVAVAGISFGGYQTLQWAVDFPDAMDAIVVASAELNGPPAEALDRLVARFAVSPHWNGGDYYREDGAPFAPMVEYRAETLEKYGFGNLLARTMPDPDARTAAIGKAALAWAGGMDANALVTLRRASVNFDVTRQLDRIRAKMLFALCRSDVLFPSSRAAAIVATLREAGVDVTYYEIDSALGHLAPAFDPGAWADALAGFLAPLAAIDEAA
jgi:homoserine O-acetyltransferase